MATRPEGLSPCFSSLASPDIPESHVFKWTPHTTQNGATITIYASNGTTQLDTYAVTGNTTEVSLDDVGYTFIPSTYYYWTVTVAGAVSMKARFLYDVCPAMPTINWTYIPKPGDVVVADTYFQEMKDNIATVIGDYEGAPQSLLDKIDTLFTGEVTPNRDDFVILESVVNYLSTELEDYKTVNIDEPVEDSLSVSDLEVVRNHIDRLLSVPPKGVQELEIAVGNPTMYSMSAFTAVSTMSADKLSLSTNLLWTAGTIPSYNGTFTFKKVSPSKDVRYYRSYFSYGTSNDPFICELYYKEEDMNDGRTDSFDTNWDGLYTASTIGLAKQSLQISAFDHRGNQSGQKSVSKVYGANFKAPLGVKEYVVEYQRSPEKGDTSYDVNGKWYSVYKGPSTLHTHKVTGAEGTIFYRVKAVDYSGLETAWKYVKGVTFDPLDPPTPPTNLKCVEQYTDRLVYSWSHGQRVAKYEIHYYDNKNNFITSWFIGDNEPITNNTSKSGLQPAHGYVLFIRSVNAAGVSEWVGCGAYTKTARRTDAKNATKGDSWNSGYNSVRTGRRIEGPHWRHENGLVYQGEWKEIKGSPNYIGPPGQTWGKHKGMWIFDDDYWRRTLAGRDIVKVELWLQRKGSAHGYYNDQVPTFWLHNYDNFPSGEPSFFGKFQPGKEFDLGESGWVTLPNWYGEYIRDNRAKGIGIYRDNWGQLPYIKFYQNAQLRITHE